MTQPNNSHLQCPVVVLTITQAQILGDEVADGLRDQLLKIAVEAEAKNVVLDFGRVTFLSSAGFRPLLSLHRLLRQQEGKLLLSGLSSEVYEIFAVTRLISTKGFTKAPFEVFPDVASAIASLYKPAEAPPA